MSDFLSEAVDTNAKLAQAWKALDRLGQVDHVRASEEFDHLGELLEHFNNTMSKPTNEYLLASDVTDEFEFDDFRADLLNYLREKAIEERRSKAEAKAHNARLGPNYWCKEAFQKGEEATFEDLDELLAPHGLASTDESETNEAASEAYACILEIVEAEFSHSGNLEHIYQLVELELRREEKHQSTEHARQILATCGLAKKEKAKKRARKK